jgi:protein YibB
MTELLGMKNLEKFMDNTVTIITAFVDIGRHAWEGYVNSRVIDSHIKRDVTTYFQRFERLTKLNNPIVCFIHSMYHDQIRAMRSDITLIAIDNILEENKELLLKIEKVQKNPHFVNYVTRPSVPEYWSPEYVFVTSRKAMFVNRAVQEGHVKTENVAWIDFGYARPDCFCPEGMTWKFETEGLIHMLCNTHTPIDALPIYEIVRTGEVFIQGCHVVAPKDKWQYMEDAFDVYLQSILNSGMSDDDQILFLMAYRGAPHLFKINYVNPNSYWFMIFKDFNNG